MQIMHTVVYDRKNNFNVMFYGRSLNLLGVTWFMAEFECQRVSPLSDLCLCT
jgi:hypothetical protein